MPSAPPDLLTRSGRRLLVEHGAFINRGLRELRPKQLDAPKLGVTLVRQLGHRQATPPSRANVLGFFSGAEANQLAELLPDFEAVRFGAAAVSSLVDSLLTVTGRSVLAVIGEAEVPRVGGGFARALDAHNRRLEVDLAKDLLGRVREVGGSRGGDGGLDADAVIVEERPGKANVLALEEASVRHNIKRWQALTSRPTFEEAKLPTETPAGFGVGAIALSGDLKVASRGGRVVEFAAAEIPCFGEGLDLDKVAALVRSTHDWLATLGVEPTALRRVYVAVPWLSVAAFVGRAFAGAQGRGPALMHPDQVFGWQPLLTLMAMLRQPDLPALFVHAGDRSVAQVCAIWAGSR